MEKGTSTRVIDISIEDLATIIKEEVQKILDQRLPKPVQKYYTVTEAAKILGTSRITLYRLKNEGKLSYRRLTGTRTIRFTQDDIDSFLLKNPGFKVCKAI